MLINQVISSLRLSFFFFWSKKERFTRFRKHAQFFSDAKRCNPNIAVAVSLIYKKGRITRNGVDSFISLTS